MFYRALAGFLVLTLSVSAAGPNASRLHTLAPASYLSAGHPTPLEAQLTRWAEMYRIAITSSPSASRLDDHVEVFEGLMWDIFQQLPKETDVLDLAKSLTGYPEFGPNSHLNAKFVLMVIALDLLHRSQRLPVTTREWAKFQFMVEIYNQYAQPPALEHEWMAPKGLVRPLKVRPRTVWHVANAALARFYSQPNSYVRVAQQVKNLPELEPGTDDWRWALAWSAFCFGSHFMSAMDLGGDQDDATILAPEIATLSAQIRSDSADLDSADLELDQAMKLGYWKALIGFSTMLSDRVAINWIIYTEQATNRGITVEDLRAHSPTQSIKKTVIDDLERIDLWLAQIELQAQRQVEASKYLWLAADPLLAGVSWHFESYFEAVDTVEFVPIAAAFPMDPIEKIVLTRHDESRNRYLNWLMQQMVGLEPRLRATYGIAAALARLETAMAVLKALDEEAREKRLTNRTQPLEFPALQRRIDAARQLAQAI